MSELKQPGQSGQRVIRRKPEPAAEERGGRPAAVQRHHEEQETLASSGGAGPDEELAGHDLSQAPLGRAKAAGFTLQANMTVNEPGDPYEVEADQVAQAVMTAPTDEEVPEAAALGLGAGIQRLPLISRLQASGGGGDVSPEVESRIGSMNGGGQALPGSERSFFEQRMGYDFSAVRVHADSNAAQTSQAIQAQAFTFGNNIAFNAGKYQPGTSQGRSLLAHELTHVVQQGAAAQRQPLLGDRAQRSEVLGHLRAMRKEHGSASTLYRQEIAAFRAANPAQRAALLQRQVLGHGVKQRGDKSRLMRVKGAPAGITFTSSAFSPGSGGALIITPNAGNVQIQGAQFSPSGNIKVSGTTDADAADWDAGFIQTMHSSSRIASYTGSAAQKTRTVSIPGPRRDALVAGDPPWYDPTNINGPGKVAFTKNDETVGTSLWDQPQTSPPWDTPDGKGKLSETSGSDVFTAWLAARKRSAPNTIEYLNYVGWKVDYRATYHYASTGVKTVKSVKGRSSITDSGSGQGSTAPVLSGATANASFVTAWS
jgi:hypothetical protein